MRTNNYVNVLCHQLYFDRRNHVNNGNHSL